MKHKYSKGEADLQVMLHRKYISSKQPCWLRLKVHPTDDMMDSQKQTLKEDCKSRDSTQLESYIAYSSTSRLQAVPKEELNWGVFSSQDSGHNRAKSLGSREVCHTPHTRQLFSICMAIQKAKRENEETFLLDP